MASKKELKEQYPDTIIVCIEDYNKSEGIIVFDFLDGDEFGYFTQIARRNDNLKGENIPSMIIMKNYKGSYNNIEEDAYYLIKKSDVETWTEENRIIENFTQSFLIGHIIDMNNFTDEVFSPCDIDDPDGRSEVTGMKIFMTGMSYNDPLPNVKRYYENIDLSGNIQVNVLNVGQGNWNEILVNDKVRFVFDIGASMYYSKNNIRNLIDARIDDYSGNHVDLVISHWDKDHYHCLLGMKDEELLKCFSSCLCRPNPPNKTTKDLYDRLHKLDGIKIYPREYMDDGSQKNSKGTPKLCQDFSTKENRLQVFNSTKHNKRNFTCISLLVKSDTACAILPADLQYSQISSGIIPVIDINLKQNFVVPHHGGDAGSFKYEKVDTSLLNQAIVSVGSNPYKHPKESIVKKLEEIGFTLFRTDEIDGKSFIDIILCIVIYFNTLCWINY